MLIYYDSPFHAVMEKEEADTMCEKVAEIISKQDEMEDIE